MKGTFIDEIQIVTLDYLGYIKKEDRSILAPSIFFLNGIAPMQTVESGNLTFEDIEGYDFCFLCNATGRHLVDTILWANLALDPGQWYVYYLNYMEAEVRTALHFQNTYLTKNKPVNLEVLNVAVQ